MKTKDYVLDELLKGYRGGFAAALADAYTRADSNNAAKLYEAFPDILSWDTDAEKAMDELHRLRSNVAYLARHMGVFINSQGTLRFDEGTDLEQLARQVDEGWNGLVADMLERFNEEKGMRKFAEEELRQAKEELKQTNSELEALRGNYWKDEG